MKYRVGFAVSGNGHLFRAAVIHRAALNICPALLIMDELCPRDLEDFSAQHGIPCVRLPADRIELRKRMLDVCVSADLSLLCLTFDRIIQSELVSYYRGRIINVHMSLLPAFRGRDGLGQAIRAGARYSGATIHEVDEEIDHGAIVAQCVVGIRANDTVDTLGARVFGLLRLMYLQVIAWYASGRVCKDHRGNIFVRDAVYGELPISPAIELSFAD